MANTRKVTKRSPTVTQADRINAFASAVVEYQCFRDAYDEFGGVFDMEGPCVASAARVTRERLLERVVDAAERLVVNGA